MKAFISILLILSIVNSHAQSVLKTSSEHDWYVNRNPIYYSESESIVAVQFNRKDQGLVKLNANGNEDWRIELKGTVLTAFKSDNKIVVLYSEEIPTRNIRCSTFDFKNGKSLQEKTAFSHSGNQIEVFGFGNNDNIAAKKLIIRTSEFSGSGFPIPMKGQLDKWKSTSKLQILNVADDLSVSLTDIKISPIPELIKGVSCNKKGEVFLIGVNESNLTVFQIDGSGNQKKRVTIPVEYNNDLAINMIPFSFFNVVAAVDEYNDDRVLVGAYFRKSKRDWANQVFLIDMIAGKGISSDVDILNKDFAKTISLTEAIGKKGDMQYIDDLKIIGFVQAQNRIIVIKEIDHYSASSTSMGSNTGGNGMAGNIEKNAAVVAFYDNNLKLIKNIGADKTFIINSLGQSTALSFKKDADKLYVLAPMKSGNLAYGALLAIINLQSGQIEKQINLTKDAGAKDEILQANAAIWLNNKLWIHTVDMTSSARKFKSYYRQIQLN